MNEYGTPFARALGALLLAAGWDRGACGTSWTHPAGVCVVTLEAGDKKAKLTRPGLPGQRPLTSRLKDPEEAAWDVSARAVERARELMREGASAS